MKGEERARMVALYEGRWAEFGRDVRTLGWNTTARQALRFEVLCDGVDLGGRRVLDVGCGFGDLAAWIDERFDGVDYCGVDLSPSLIERARLDRPGGEFRCVDLLEQPIEGRFDWVFASGVLSYRLDDNPAHSQAMMRAMWSLAEEGLAVNFLTSHVHFERPHNFHHDPEWVFGLARSMTPWVTLRHDYPLWEFTAQLRREARS